MDPECLQMERYQVIIRGGKPTIYIWSASEDWLQHGTCEPSSRGYISVASQAQREYVFPVSLHLCEKGINETESETSSCLLVCAWLHQLQLTFCFVGLHCCCGSASNINFYHNKDLVSFTTSVSGERCCLMSLSKENYLKPNEWFWPNRNGFLKKKIVNASKRPAPFEITTLKWTMI